MKILLILSCILLMGISQCNHKVQNPILGEYELEGQDNSGRPAFSGTMSLVSLEPDLHETNLLKGQCTIVRQQNAPEGLLDNNAICQGLLKGNKLDMDLAPFMDDAGLLLEGEFHEGRIFGTWSLDGFVGSGPLGRFNAVKKR